jgi:hypothetical protein
MEYYDLQENDNTLVITFHSNLPDYGAAQELKLLTSFKEYVANSKCSVMICDLSKSNYKTGAYISAVWLVGLAYKKKIYIVAKASQVENLKSLMKINIEVPIYTDINDVITKKQ